MAAIAAAATATAAVRLAQVRMQLVVAAELWWVRNRDTCIRDGGSDARRGVATLAAWAAKWSGLFRLRRGCPEGFEAKPRTPMVVGWPKGQ